MRARKLGPALFFGTSAFAVPMLETAAAHAELVGVVTQPDRPAGRGHRLTPSPVKAAALQMGLAVYQPARAGELVAIFGDRALDVLVLASYGRMLPQAVLDLAPGRAFNVHPSLLPRYRGATPIQTALRDGERRTGVSVMLMDGGMDTGPLVGQRAVAIDPLETYGRLHDRLADEGARLLGSALEAAASGALHPRPQIGVASITRPIRTADLAIEWSWPAARIVDWVRAYSPQPAARARFEGQWLKLLRAHLDDDDRLVVDETIAPNRGKMSGAAFLAGRTWPQE